MSTLTRCVGLASSIIIIIIIIIASFILIPGPVVERIDVVLAVLSCQISSNES